MRIRVICKGLDPLNATYGTRVVNAETGEAISHVKSVVFRHEAGSLPVVCIEVLDFDVEAELIYPADESPNDEAHPS